jgi:hypothetical protein
MGALAENHTESDRVLLGGQTRAGHFRLFRLSFSAHISAHMGGTDALLRSP